LRRDNDKSQTASDKNTIKKYEREMTAIGKANLGTKGEISKMSPTR
jgi:hypothetical protein